MWALTDFTEANGATRLVPGIAPADHSPDLRRDLRHDPGRDGRGQRARLARQRCGTAAARTRTDERRVGIAMNYCAGWIRQQENQQLGIPREIAARLLAAPARARRLRHLPRADRPHRQARPGGPARRVERCVRPDGVGPTVSSTLNIKEIPAGAERRRLIPLLDLAEDSDSQLEAAIDEGVMYAVIGDDHEHIGVVLALTHTRDEVELRYVAVADVPSAQGHRQGDARPRRRREPREGPSGSSWARAQRTPATSTSTSGAAFDCTRSNGTTSRPHAGTRPTSY